MNELKYIRVMQHDLHGDNIRIGREYPILDDTPESFDKAEAKATEAYEASCAWCGGFEKAAEKYYKRIALVDADTLKVLRLIYPKP